MSQSKLSGHEKMVVKFSEAFGGIEQELEAAVIDEHKVAMLAWDSWEDGDRAYPFNYDDLDYTGSVATIETPTHQEIKKVARWVVAKDSKHLISTEYLDAACELFGVDFYEDTSAFQVKPNRDGFPVKIVQDGLTLYIAPRIAPKDAR